MAYDLNFALLGAPVDIGTAISTGYQHGRQMRQQAQQDSAFAMLARDPNSPEGRALLTSSGRPDLARQFRTWGREDRREEMYRSAFGGGPAPAAPTASAPVAPAFAAPNAPVGAAASPSASPSASVPASPAPIAPPAASQAPDSSRLPPLNPQLMRQYFAEDPEGAQELVATWNRLDGLQRAEQTRRFAAAVPILSEVARLPVEQRGAAVRSQQEYLVNNGWTPEQIENFAANPSDQAVRMLLRLGVPIAEQRQFFAPLEGGQGETYRDPVTLTPLAANPSQPRTVSTYDTNGNEIIETVPGTPAIGPGANLFGAGASGGQVQPPRVLTDDDVRAAERGGVTTPASAAPDLDNWNRAGRAGPGGPRTFP